MRLLNTRLLLVLLGSAVVLAAGLFAVHWMQTGRIAQGLLFQARRAEEQGDRDQTARYLSRYLEFEPDDLTEQANLARVVAASVLDGDQPASAKARQRAVFVLERAVAQDASRADLRRQLAKILMLDRRPDLALGHIKALPQDAEALDLAGQCHEAEGHVADAAASYWKSIETEPTREISYTRLAELMRNPIAAGLTLPVASVGALLDMLVERNPGSSEALVTRWRFRPAGLAKNPEQLEKAGRDVVEALKLAPDNVEVLLAAAELAQIQALALPANETAEHDAALARGREHVEKAARLHPKEPRVYTALAQLETSARRSEAAIAALDRGLKSLPAHPDLLWMLGNLLLEGGRDEARFARAREVVEQLRQGHASQVVADYLQGRLALVSGRYREAVEKFESARILLDRNPAMAALASQVDLYLARCYEQSDELAPRVQALERVVGRSETTDPGSATLASARRDLAASLASQGRYDEAVSVLTKVAAAPGAPKSAWTDLAQMMLTLKAVRKVGDWKEIEKTIEKAGTEALEPYILEARMLIMQGKSDLAEERLVMVSKAFPKRPEPWVVQVALAEMNENPAKALELLDEAEKQVGDAVELRLARVRHWGAQPKDRAAPELKKLAESIDTLKNEDDRVSLLRALVESNFRVGLSAEAGRLWDRLAALPRYADDLRIRQVQFDMSLEARDWEKGEAVLKEIVRVEGASGPIGSYGRAMLLMRQAEARKEAPPAEARELLERVAAARPKWTAVQMARAELELKSRNLEQAVLRLREAVATGEGRNPKIVNQLVAVLRQLGRNDEATAEVRKLTPEALAEGGMSWVAVDLALRENNPALAVQRAMAAVPADSRIALDYVRLGLVLAADGKKREAEKNLRKAVSLAGDDPEPWVALCQFLFAERRLPDAESLLTQAAKDVPEASRVLTLARCREILGQADQARKLYQEALAAKPEDVATIRVVVNFYIRNQKSNEAEPLLRSVYESKMKITQDDRDWSRRALALLRAADQDFRRVTEAFELVGLRYVPAEGRVVSTTDAATVTAEERRVRARVLATQPQKALRTTAVEYLTEIESAGALTTDDRYLLAQLHESLGAPAKSRAQWQALVSGPSVEPRFLSEYAQHLLRHNQLGEALTAISRLEAAEKSAKAPPGSFGSVSLTVALLEARGESDRALGTLEKHVRRDGAQPEEMLVLAAALARHKKVREALDICESSWDKCSAEAVSSASLGVLLHAPRPFDDLLARVMKRVELASQKKPESVLLLLNLGDLNDLKGDYLQAQTMYRQALDKDPKNVVALNNLAWLMIQTSGDSREALKLISQAIDGVGERPELLDTRGTVLLAQKRTQQAIADLERANAESRTGSRAFHLAQAYYLANDRAGALKALRDAQQAGLSPERLHPTEQPALKRLMSELKPQ